MKITGKLQNLKSRMTKKRMAVPIFLVVLLLAGLSAVLYSLNSKSTQRSETDEASYSSINEALKSGIKPDLSRQYEGYYSALRLYQRGEFSQAAIELEELLKTGLNTELEPGVYALAYNTYIKLNKLENAKKIVLEYKKTKSYSNLDDGTKKSWEDTLAQLNRGEAPSDTTGGEGNE